MPCPYSITYLTLTVMSFRNEWYTEQYFSWEREMTRSIFLGVIFSPEIWITISIDV